MSFEVGRACRMRMYFGSHRPGRFQPIHVLPSGLSSSIEATCLADDEERARLARLFALQHRLCAPELDVGDDPPALHSALRRALLKASDRGTLSTPPDEVMRKVRIANTSTSYGTAHIITCGEKDIKRRHPD